MRSCLFGDAGREGERVVGYAQFSRAKERVGPEGVPTYLVGGDHTISLSVPCLKGQRLFPTEILNNL